MALRRFRTHEAAAAALWTTPDDPALWPRIVRNLRRSKRLLPPDAPPYPRGLQRFRTREEAERAHTAWEAERVAAATRRTFGAAPDVAPPSREEWDRG